jgi:hypothetical protein
MLRPMRLPNILSGVSQLIWADAIFVRGFPEFDSYSSDKLIKGATLLNVIYLSYDMVNLMLEKLDALEGTIFAKTYLAELNKRSDITRHMLNINE